MLLSAADNGGRGCDAADGTISKESAHKVSKRTAFYQLFSMNLMHVKLQGTGSSLLAEGGRGRNPSLPSMFHCVSDD
jgi:hypothetical protein